MVRQTMLLTRHFVFVHVPKTGGNFVHRVLRDHAPKNWQLQKLEDHATHLDIPASHAQLPRLAFVRNPYAWYVSWFHFQQNVRADFFLEISLGGQLDFASTVRRALGPGGPFEKTAGPFLQTLEEMLGPGLPGVRCGKVRSLREDLLRMVGECVTVPPRLASAIGALPPQNASEHAHYSHYYDPELRDLVRAKEAPIFDHFGYEWEDAPAAP